MAGLRKLKKEVTYNLYIQKNLAKSLSLSIQETYQREL